MSSSVQWLIHPSVSPDTQLPQSRPLTLTRNFACVVFFCFATLISVPFMLAWIANLLLN